MLLDFFQPQAGWARGVAKGTLVHTDQGVIPIESVGLGDYVLTHGNCYRPVLNIQKSVTKTVYKLTIQGTLPLTLMEAQPCRCKIRRIVRNKEAKKYEKTLSTPKWRGCGSLKNGDYLGHPILAAEKNPYNLTAIECYLVGRYISSGYLQNQYRNRVYYYVGRKDEENFLLYAKWYDPHRLNRQEKGIRYYLNDARLAGICRECGRNKEKQLPYSILLLPPELLRRVIEGYLMVDGFYDSKRKMYIATTSSVKFALSLQAAIHKAYDEAAYIQVAKSGRVKVLGRDTVRNTKYFVLWSGGTGAKQKAVVGDRQVWHRVTKIEKLEKPTIVYSLTVATDNSFTANGIIVRDMGD